MNRRNLRILLEAVAVTACLLVIVGQHSEAEITSQATAHTFQKGFQRDTRLLVGRALTRVCGKASGVDSDTDEVVEQ